MSGGWGGRKAQRLTALTLATYGSECWLRWDHKCTTVATTADHVIPRALGGPDDLDNLRPACLHCNSARGKRPMSARPRAVEPVDGLGFFQTTTPEATRQPFHFFPTTKQISDSDQAKTDEFAFWLNP